MPVTISPDSDWPKWPALVGATAPGRMNRRLVWAGLLWQLNGGFVGKKRTDVAGRWLRNSPYLTKRKQKGLAHKMPPLSIKGAWHMTTLSSTTSAIGALGLYLSQPGTSSASSGSSTSTSGSTASTDDDAALITLLDGTNGTSSSNLAVLLGTGSSNTSTDTLGTLLGTSTISTDSLLTQVSNLATAIASGTSTSTDGSSDSAGTTSSSSTPSPTQIAQQLLGAYTQQQQNLISLLV